MRLFCTLFLLLFFADLQAAITEPHSVETKTIEAYVIPIEGPITEAQFYILRRGLKTALLNKAACVILVLNTPGGALETTLKMMEMLENFTQGEVFSFVNKEALSAGAFIASATERIYFHPQGVLGAAAAVLSSGAEVSETMKHKINSYLNARVRSYTEKYRYRAAIVRAMMETDYELVLEGHLLKPKGELLTLTASEAVKTYGFPPEPLFSSGTVDSAEALLKVAYPQKIVNIHFFQLTGAEKLARWLNTITPLLLGLGMLMLFIEFKTPGFGIFGVLGIALIALVFMSSYLAGLAGFEPAVIFLVGIVLLAVELFIVPGVLFVGLSGVLLIFGSLVWTLADIWPKAAGYAWNWDLFIGPLKTLFFSLGITLVGGYICNKLFFKRFFKNVLILQAADTGKANSAHGEGGSGATLVGKLGVAASDLLPSGIVEIEGKRYTAKSILGPIERHAQIKVVAEDAFALIVSEEL